MKERMERFPVVCSLHELIQGPLGLDFPEMNDPGVAARCLRTETVFRKWYNDRDEEDNALTRHLVIAPRASCKTTVEEIGLSALIRLMDGGLRVGSPRGEANGLEVDSMLEFFDRKDVMLMVDPVGIEDMHTSINWPEQSWKLYQNAVNGLEKNGLLILVTCRLHENDLVGQLAKREPDLWTVDATAASDYPTIWPEAKVKDLLSTARGKADSIQIGLRGGIIIKDI